MTDLSEVRIEVLASNVGLLEFRRPPNNYFDTSLIRQLVAGITNLVKGGCRAAVLCSEGKHFCAGAQLGKQGTDERSIYQVALELFAVDLPIVVAVQGAAVGGGMGLALVGDFRVGLSTTSFRPNFARLGINHGFGITETLPAVVGEHRALQLLERGAPIKSDEALALGLLDAVVPEAELRDKAVRLAIELAANAPQAVRTIRRLMRHGLVERLRVAVEHEGAAQMTLMRTNDFREGVAAMSDRRPPNFTNS